MAYSLTPDKEIRNRVASIQQTIIKQNLDGIMLTNNVDIYYFSGTMQNSYMYIPANGEPLLFVKKSISRANLETPFGVIPIKGLKGISEHIQGLGNSIANMGIDLDVLPFNQFQRIKNTFPETTFVDISNALRLQRCIKSEYEISLIKESAKVVYDAMIELPNIYKKGMREFELSAALEKFIRDRGHIGYIRTRTYNMELVLGMVTSGTSSSTPSAFDGPAGGQGLTPAMPQSSGWKEIAENEPILVDISAAVNGYIVDQTRMAVIGELDSELENAYTIAIQILKDTEKNARPGTTWSEHYVKALDMAYKANLADYFMGYKDDQAKFLGHGVGLELDELPVLAKGFDIPLEKGMVIAVEPKFTFPSKGVIGIENTYVVSEHGLTSLSYAPEEIIRIPLK